MGHTVPRFRAPNFLRRSAMSLSQSQSLSLLDMPSGCKLCVEELTGSPSMRSRLYSMGILPGTEMELCRGGCGSGTVCVRVRHCSLVLGEGMARAIFCRPADGGHEHHRRHHHHPHSHHHHGRMGFKGACHGEAAPCCCADTTQSLSSRPLSSWSGDASGEAKKDTDD